MYVLLSYKSRDVIAINTLKNSLCLKYYKKFNDIFGSFTGFSFIASCGSDLRLTFVTLDPLICDKAGMPNHNVTWFDILAYPKFHSRWFKKCKLLFAIFFSFFN